MAADGRDLKALGITDISHYNRSPLFTPDGKSILFLAGTETTRNGRFRYSLWRADLQGKKRRRVAGSDVFTDPQADKP
jgi:Tol biopolymer transport system component